MGAADWYFKYTGSDLADWFDAQDEKYWRQHDEWLIESQRVGDASPVVVFANWVNDRLATLPTRVGGLITGGFVDALRIGNDFDPDGGFWGAGKGAVLNLLRVITVLEPVVKGASLLGGASAIRDGGIRATSALSDIAQAKGPCAFVNINNILSYLSGKKVQLFADLADIRKLAGGNEGIGARTLLESDVVQAALKQYGISARLRTGLKSVEAVLREATSSEGPIAFSIEWKKTVGQLKPDAHRLLAVKDAAGNVRILDYAPSDKKGTFEGFRSLADILAIRPWYGEGFLKAQVILDSPVYEFVSAQTSKLALLEFADASLSFGLPLVLGVKWNIGHTPDERMREMARSAFEFLKTRLLTEAPPPPVPSVLPQLPAQPLVPRTPDVTRKRLANTPLATEAKSAPRIDWLTGVQYRLKYLNYYRGPVHGINDRPTKAAVLAFQKSWFDSRADWDSIPGPRTQAALYAAIGW